MAKKITKDEIFEKGLLSDVIHEAEKAIVVFDKLDVELEKVSKSYKSIVENSSKNSKGSITELVNASKALNQITEETVKIEKEKLKVDREIRITRKEQLSAEQSLQRQREKSIAQMEKEAKRAQELARPYNSMSNRLNQLRKDYKDLAVAGNENTASARKMKVEIDSLDRTLKKADGSVGQFQRNVGNYPKLFSSITSALTQLGLGFGIFTTIRGIVDTEIKLQSLQLALKNVMGTTERYNQSFKFLTELSRNYGQDLTVLTDTYKNFIASSESSGLSLEKRNKIYQSVIKSGSSLALSNDQIQGSLLAVSQMFSKGTVSAEELRGQLGERLPGAFGIMAKSIGVSESELGKMMQKGEVMAKDVLPKFAEELEKSFGANASKNLETIGGAWNVLQTEVSLYINEANKGGAITKQIAGAIGFLASNLDTVVSILKIAIRQFIIYKILQSEIVKNGLDFIKVTKKSTQAISENATATESASSSSSKFKDSLKSIGWSVAIGFAFELGAKLWNIANGAEDAALALEQMQKSVANGKSFGSGVISDLANKKTDLDARLKNRKITQKQYEDELNDLKKASYSRVAWEIKTEKEEIALARQKIQKLKPLYDEVMSINPLFRDASMLRIIARYETQKNVVKQSLASIDELTIGYQNLDFEVNENSKGLEKNTKKQKENNKERKDASEWVKNLTSDIDEYRKSMQELDDFLLNSSLSNLEKEFQQALDFELEKINKNGEYSIDILTRIIDKEDELKKAIIERQYLEDISNAKNSADYELAEKKRNKALQDLDDETRKKKKETNKQLELEQEKHAENEYKIDKEAQEKKDKLQKEADDKEKARLEEMRNFRRKIVDDIIDELKRQSEARESLADKDIQTQKDFQAQLQAQANAGNITAQQSIAQSIENEKKATLAKAKEQKKQQQLDDVKTLFNLINQNIDKGDNAGIATVKATASMSLIKSIAKMFQGFAKGTKWRLGQEDNPFMSGVDGHIVRVDSSEAIVNGGLMNKAEKAGIRSTDQLVNSAIMYQAFNPNSIKMNDDRIAFSASNIEPITQRLESLENTIKNKTEFRIEPYILHGIHKGIVQVEKTKNLTRKTIIKS